MKVLVVSHTVFSRTANMGKTLRSYFEGMNECELAQLYIHSEIPTDTVCKTYYRMTDKEIIKSIFTRNSGRVFGETDISADIIDPRTDTGNTAKLYQFARRRTPIIYLLRNMWWSLGAWKTSRLLAWIDDFDPDVVFFASGDYSFLYKVALEIAQYKKIPLAITCMDDYYLNNKNADKIGGKLLHRLFMRQVRKTVDYAGCLFSICEKMSQDYGKLFDKPSYTLCTPASICKPLSCDKTNAISYIGNLGYKREEQLVKLGRALKKIEVVGKPEYIDVYTAEKAPERLKNLTEENGLKYRGSISSDEVLAVMGKSLAVIHTESFDSDTRKSVAYSVSTKIADSLASGTCLLAYGPEEVASMDYLIQNQAACCITSDERLEQGLIDLLQNEELRKRYVANALALANRNHDSDRNRAIVANVLRELIAKNRENL